MFKSKIAKRKLNVINGPTFRFFYIGLTAIACGIYSYFNLNNYLASLLFLFGVFLFLSINGTVIDVEQRKVKHYFNILFFRVGTWKSLDQFSRVELRGQSNSQTFHYRSVSSSINVKSYSIFLIQNQKEKIELKEFRDYKQAKAFLLEIGEKLDLKQVNYLSRLDRVD